MPWLEVSVSLHRDALEAAAEILMDIGATGVEIDDPLLMLQRQVPTSEWDYADLPPGFDPEAEAVLRAWLFAAETDKEHEKQIREQIKEKLQFLKECDIQTGTLNIASCYITEENWTESWKEFFKPIFIGKSLVIKPSWETLESEPDENRIVIELDPGMAFGTGQHATTRMCLVLLEQHLKPGDSVVDVGCGSGILSVAAAKLGAAKIVALDTDPLAVESTIANLHSNGLDCSETAQSSSDPAITVEKVTLSQAASTDADIIVVNIVADVIINLLSEIAKAMKPEGTLLCSGILTSRQDDVEAALQAHGFAIIEKLYEDDWLAYAAKLSANH